MTQRDGESELVAWQPHTCSKYLKICLSSEDLAQDLESCGHARQIQFHRKY
jgi:hypothetical protein